MCYEIHQIVLFLYLNTPCRKLIFCEKKVDNLTAKFSRVMLTRDRTDLNYSSHHRRPNFVGIFWRFEIVASSVAIFAWPKNKVFDAQIEIPYSIPIAFFIFLGSAMAFPCLQFWWTIFFCWQTLRVWWNATESCNMLAVCCVTYSPDKLLICSGFGAIFIGSCDRVGANTSSVVR